MSATALELITLVDNRSETTTLHHRTPIHRHTRYNMAISMVMGDYLFNGYSCTGDVRPFFIMVGGTPCLSVEFVLLI